MIDVKELRIGNYVANPHWENRIEEICEIHYKGGLIVNVKDYRYHYQVKQNCEDIIPIPLTPEILVKMGFNHAEYKFFAPNSPFILTDSPVLKGACYYFTTYKKDWTLAKLNYVHQLQNLYFALTGKEIEFTL